MSYRVVIGGGPRTGKSTFAAWSRKAILDTHGHAPDVLCTDDLIGSHDWSAASEVVATWLDRPGPWILEGVAAIRGLRKWLRANATGRPADAVILFWTPYLPLTPGQQTMAKGCQTVWREIAHELHERGVTVQTQDETHLYKMLAGFA